MQTAPPARGNYSETVNQWLIYDNYVTYETAKELADEKENKKEQKDGKVYSTFFNNCIKIKKSLNFE